MGKTQRAISSTNSLPTLLAQCNTKGVGVTDALVKALVITWNKSVDQKTTLGVHILFV